MKAHRKCDVPPFTETRFHQNKTLQARAKSTSVARLLSVLRLRRYTRWVPFEEYIRDRMNSILETDMDIVDDAAVRLAACAELPLDTSRHVQLVADITMALAFVQTLFPPYSFPETHTPAKAVEAAGVSEEAETK